MNNDETREFLNHGTRTGKVATVGADGSPHVAPVWFVFDGSAVVFTTGADTVKGRNLRRDPRIAMSVDDECPPYSFVYLRGTVELSDDGDALLDAATRLGGRYMGAERAEEFGRRNAVEGELLVRFIPDRIVAVKDLAD
ncbi:MAG: PPOX class F420-dependent oxidoreductase [Actinobacteria bacterium]|nr:PPOX class F420-dependent oxidoreductase [Actinomycetota bacterium]